jgi:hypothetical protein
VLRKSFAVLLWHACHRFVSAALNYYGCLKTCLSLYTVLHILSQQLPDTQSRKGREGKGDTNHKSELQRMSLNKQRRHKKYCIFSTAVTERKRDVFKYRKGNLPQYHKTYDRKPRIPICPTAEAYVTFNSIKGKVRPGTDHEVPVGE